MTKEQKKRFKEYLLIMDFYAKTRSISLIHRQEKGLKILIDLFLAEAKVEELKKSKKELEMLG